jgi:hypothetical protein
MLTCGVAGLLIGVAGFAIADAPKTGDKPAAGAAPEMKLPPGWTESDMKACMAAGTPGKMQEHLAKDAGTWTGKSTMWMGPDSPPMPSELTCTVTPIMGGRYTQMESKGEMPGMGPFQGIGTYGFDNVSQKFVATWIDNQGTGIMNGTGELSKDGKVLTWNFTFNCPITKKPTPFREVDTETGPNTKVLEMWSIEPKSGKEFKAMRIELTKKQ